MRIIRYSKHGFKPQHQTHHLKTYVNYHMNEFDENLFPEHMRKNVKKENKEMVKFYEENIEDLKEGVWVFIEGHKCNQALNHLKEKVPCWSAELPDDTEVYHVNWDGKLLLSDDLIQDLGCYVPKRSLEKIQNVKRVKAQKKERGK